MSKKMIGHGVFKIKTGEEDSWVCSIGRCEQKADLMIVKSYSDGTETHGGGCFKCTER